MKNKLTYTGTDNTILILPKSLKLFCTATDLPAEFYIQLSKIKWKDPALIENLKTLAHQSKFNKAARQALLDLDRRVSAYHQLIEAIRRQISDPKMIAVVWQEIHKDMHTSVERQKSNHSSLHRLPQTETPQNPLTKDQTSRLITAIVNYLKNA